MIIGIDASRGWEEQKTGTERYAYEILRHIMMLEEFHQHTWILYTKFQIPNPKNVKVIQIKFPYLWTQVGLAYHTWVDKLDVLWVPAHALPFFTNPKLRTVVTVHGLEYEWLPSFKNWLQRWYLPFSTWFVAKRASRLIAVSEFTKRELMQRLGVQEKKISVIHEGITTSPSIPLLSSRKLVAAPYEREVLEKYGLKTKRYILTVGTVQPRKNLRRLVEAVAKIGGELQLVIAGKLGWDFAEVVQLARKQGVIITGYIDDAERSILLANAVVYVQASITEGFGLPVIEAMAAGIPVVSSNGGALAEIVAGGGVLFDPLDVNAISHSLALVIHSHSLRKELIAKGLQRAKDFDWDKAAKETYKVLVNKNDF